MPRPGVGNRLTRRRLLGLAAVSAGAAFSGPVLTGCGKDSAKGGGSTALTFMNQSRGQAKALDKLVETYKKQTGVRVTIDSPGPTNFRRSCSRSRSRVTCRTSTDAHAARDDPVLQSRLGDESGAEADR